MIIYDAIFDFPIFTSYHQIPAGYNANHILRLTATKTESRIWIFSVAYIFSEEIEILERQNANISQSPRMSLGGNCPWSQLFWSAYSTIRTEYREIINVFSTNAGRCGPE